MKLRHHRFLFSTLLLAMCFALSSCSAAGFVPKSDTTWGELYRHFDSEEFSELDPQLQQMMDDCRADGLNPYICASYRTMKKQKALFADKVKRVLLEGCPKDEAEDEAAKTVARPGTSEHQLGLALDIVDADDPQLETWQEDTPVQQWLMKNSWKYGFVLRYPPEKSSITGIIYEPWHYRYVGRQAAEEMHNKGLCLEEYLKEREEG